jgi:hypothetical protein
VNVTFKPLGKREREWLLARGVRHVPRRDEDRYFGRGSVVTLDGFIVLAFDRHGQVIYQDGSDAIPDLVRARKRVAAALVALTEDDFDRIRRKGARRLSVEEILRGEGTDT